MGFYFISSLARFILSAPCYMESFVRQDINYRNTREVPFERGVIFPRIYSQEGRHLPLSSISIIELRKNSIKTA